MWSDDVSENVYLKICSHSKQSAKINDLRAADCR